MKTLILEANKSIQAVMSGAAASTNPDFVSNFADSFTATFGVDTEDGALNGTTPVTLVSAPSASGRDVREIIIFNRDTADVTITVSYNNNGTLRTIDKFTLAPDEKWVFSEAGAAAAAGGSGVTDAADLTYTPAVNADWNGSADPGDTNNALDQLAERVKDVEGAPAGAAFWTTVPGTPTRVSDTQFTITDTANANLYDKLFVKGVILRWLETSTFQTAMVISSSYAADAVTINIVGDSLTAGFTVMKYALNKALRFEFIIPGAIAAATDSARTHYPECNIFKLSVDARVKTAGVTNATVFDINDDGTTIITTKPSIASTALTDLDNVCDNPSTVIAANSILTCDVDSVSTTPPVEAYIDFWYYPEWWKYLS